MRRMWIMWATLIVLAAAAGQTLADSGGAGVSMGKEYKRFSTFVKWSE